MNFQHGKYDKRGKDIFTGRFIRFRTNRRDRRCNNKDRDGDFRGKEIGIDSVRYKCYTNAKRRKSQCLQKIRELM